MWLLFKGRLMDGVVQYVPKISQFYDWHNPFWKCLLSAVITTKIKNKHMIWKQYLVAQNVEFFHKYKRLHNQIRKITKMRLLGQQKLIQGSFGLRLTIKLH